MMIFCTGLYIITTENIIIMSDKIKKKSRVVCNTASIEGNYSFSVNKNIL